jgi:hypothetical protein
MCRFMSISNVLFKNAMHRHSDLNNNNQPEDTVPLIDHDHQHNICKCKCSCLPRFLTCCFSVSCLHCKYTIFFNFIFTFFYIFTFYFWFTYTRIFDLNFRMYEKFLLWPLVADLSMLFFILKIHYYRD